jgi:dephospho-CoA kinase
MIKVGITGGMGAGKSTVCKLFKDNCYVPVYDSDSKVKHLMVHNMDLVEDIKKILPDAYGVSLTTFTSITIDKEYVAKKIFEDSSLRKEIQEIIHPYLWQDFEDWCKSLEGKHDYVIFESAILVEAGLVDEFDKIIVVTADLETRLERLEKFRNISRKQAMSRIENQISDLKRLKYADYVIKNDKNLKVSHYSWYERRKEEIKENMSSENIELKRKEVLIKRIEQIDHKIKYISYGSRNNEEQS